MLIALAPGWKTELDRGPEWLFVKLYGPDSDAADATGLAESLYTLLRQEFKQRLLLELDNIQHMPRDLVIELHLLRDELEREGSLLRVCGLCAEHEVSLSRSEFSPHLLCYPDRDAALLGFFRPSKPR